MAFFKEEECCYCSLTGYDLDGERCHYCDGFGIILTLDEGWIYDNYPIPFDGDEDSLISLLENDDVNEKVYECF